jgi:Zn-dependent M28 family amino/carboxypeptidase
MKNKLAIIISIFILIGCGGDDKPNKEVKNNTVTPPPPKIEHPEFNEDSAYLYVKEQVDFGPRFPNNEAHGKCAKYLESKLRSFGLDASIQIGKGTTFNNKEITIKNVIGEYNLEANKRILLFAHWDSRPFADQDTKNMTKPILGANDGASGVGVLLEVARQLSLQKPSVGVDIIFFDAEDYGQPSSGMVQTDSETWCLGSQYWGKNPHRPGYTANYGILLDMVGNTNAYFTQESISLRYAPEVVHKVWNNARLLGYSNFFVNKQTAFVGTDDHQFVNELAGIPSIDIIHYDRASGNFHPTWHTHADNMDIIDKNTLNAVGEVLLYTIYQENQ